ncbi:MAG: NnrU family protein [Pseudomonadota bacterium]
MTLLILGLILWFATHLLAIKAPAARAGLTNAVGELPSKGIMAVLTLASVVLMVKGYQGADYIELWLAPPFLTHLNNLLMLVAIFVFIAGNMPSVIRNKIRHPQLAAAKIWALAHLLVNGDVASVILFGGILAWAVIALIGTNKRDGKPPLEKKATMLGLGIHAVVALVAYVVVGYIHMWAGIWPFGGDGPPV